MTPAKTAVLKTDLCVIGAGAGGLSVAAGAVQMGARVVLIEAGEMGGDCLNHGCVPSKALLAAAARAQAMRAAAGFGIAAVDPQVDFAAVKDHVARTIAAIAPHDSQARFEALGCTVIRAHARFTGRDTVQAGGRTIRARRFVIATGSRPAIPPLPGLQAVPYLTNETLFALREAPGHLLILGGGPIGVEMAQAHRRLGVPVTLVESGRLLGREDPDLVAILRARLQAEGVVVIEGIAAAQVAGVAGDIALTLADGRVLRGSHLLLATGRRAALDGLELEAAGVAHGPQGVLVDAGLRAQGNARIFAVGDAAGQGQFTHLAGSHAGVVIRRALFGLPAKAGAAVPRVTYADPELAQIGLTEAEARATHGAAVQVLRWGFDQNDRALAMRTTEGLMKAMVVKGRVVGVSILGPQAGELLAPWAMVLGRRGGPGTLAGLMLPYPTLSEVSKRTAAAYFSAKLFDNAWLKRGVRLVQRLLP